MTKYAANAMLATKISFINEMANHLRSGSRRHQRRARHRPRRRIGFDFLFPGVGYGGSCFPKDIKAIIHLSNQAGLPPHLMEAVDRVNERQKQVLVEKVRRHYGDALREKTLAVWGLAFKPRTDDVREAPSLALIDALLAEGVKLRVHDPEAAGNVRRLSATG